MKRIVTAALTIAVMASLSVAHATPGTHTTTGGAVNSIGQTLRFFSGGASEPGIGFASVGVNPFNPVLITCMTAVVVTPPTDHHVFMRGQEVLFPFTDYYIYIIDLASGPDSFVYKTTLGSGPCNANQNPIYPVTVGFFNTTP